MKNNKKSKKIIKIILVCILMCIIIFSAYLFIKYKIEKANVKKMANAVNEVNKERIDYVFIEINPSFVLTIKDNKVNDIACLNDDCLSIYNEINIKGKGINESIDFIYNLSTEKGFDTSKGVKVKATNGSINIEEKNYIEVIYINEQEKEQLLLELKNNEGIKKVNNDNYYTKLWEELKKDNKYGKVYSCNMTNDELECYIILETGINKDSDYDMDTKEDYNKYKSLISNSSSDVYNTFEKFGIKINNKKAYIGSSWYTYTPLYTFNGTPYKNVLLAELVEKFDDKYCERGYTEYIDGKCEVKDGYNIILLNKLNLVNPIINSNNLIVINFGFKDNILKMYEFDPRNDHERCVNEELSQGNVWKEFTGWNIDGTKFTEYMWCSPDDNCHNGCDPNTYNEE